MTAPIVSHASTQNFSVASTSGATSMTPVGRATNAVPRRRAAISQSPRSSRPAIVRSTQSGGLRRSRRAGPGTACGEPDGSAGRGTASVGVEAVPRAGALTGRPVVRGTGVRDGGVILTVLPANRRNVARRHR